MAKKEPRKISQSSTALVLLPQKIITTSLKRLQGESNIPRVVSLRHSRCATSHMAGLFVMVLCMDKKLCHDRGQRG
ncbi:hypothetical protein EYF80_028825 [Liparis tanakae]|uniref:Uncharacterized protein n=1 Tax=Liparis tanakae TaxID=230148 RepID=A0A4Z2H6S1_9TELE|nr:hypothetical protein EYF80_028825 [Liparis tanakae]